MARHGFVVIVPEYRVYPEVRFPDFLADGAKAVRWAAQNAARFGGDPGKLFLLGHSAGAHIAAMLAFDGQWLAREEMDPRRDIAGFVDLAGPYDFLPLTNPVLVTIFGGPSVPETQPINFVAGGEPPALLATGKRDRSVNPGNSAHLAARLRREGGDATHIVYPYVSHLSLIAAFAPLAKLLAPVKDNVAEFVQRVAGAQPR